jgi:hypothetical protein
LAQKVFAFSKIDIDALNIMEKLKWINQNKSAKYQEI